MNKQKRPAKQRIYITSALIIVLLAAWFLLADYFVRLGETIGRWLSTL